MDSLYRLETAQRWRSLGNGQNTSHTWEDASNQMLTLPLLGKAIRIPADNPFVVSGGLPNLRLGLRNPWRFSLNPLPSPVRRRRGPGQLGRNRYSSEGGHFGWNVMEGMHCYPPT